MAQGSQLRISNPWVSRVPQSKFEANRSMGSKVLIGKKYKQTNQDYNFMNIDAKKEEIFSLLEKN